MSTYQTLPPNIGDDGRDSYPFSITEHGRTERYSHWFDALARKHSALDGRGRTRTVIIEGVHPSHQMVPWASSSACDVCEAAEGTDGIIAPCGYETAGRSMLEVAGDEKANYLAGVR